MVLVRVGIVVGASRWWPVLDNRANLRWRGGYARIWATGRLRWAVETGRRRRYARGMWTVVWVRDPVWCRRLRLLRLGVRW